MEYRLSRPAFKRYQQSTINLRNSE
jgi:hypothetical protein